VHEAYLKSIGNLYPILILGAVFGCALALLAMHGIRRFVLTPLGGDPEMASKLVQRIAQGDLDEDGMHAPPDTLIHNMLKMRTRLHEMVNEIKTNADRLRVSSSVFEHAHDGIFITDLKAQIMEVNPAFTVITGYSREEALGKKPEDLGFAYQIDAFFLNFSNPPITKASGEVRFGAVTKMVKPTSRGWMYSQCIANRVSFNIMWGCLLILRKPKNSKNLWSIWLITTH